MLKQIAHPMERAMASMTEEDELVGVAMGTQIACRQHLDVGGLNAGWAMSRFEMVVHCRDF